MDTHAYDEWLALWSEEARYWIPANADDIDPRTHISLANEDRAGVEDRVARLKSGAYYAQNPKSRLSRIISNIEIEPGTADLVSVHSTFNITASRKGRIDIIAGRTLHKLQRREGNFRIAYKRILLVTNDEVINNLSILI